MYAQISVVDVGSHKKIVAGLSGQTYRVTQVCISILSSSAQRPSVTRHKRTELKLSLRVLLSTPTIAVVEAPG